MLPSGLSRRYPHDPVFIVVEGRSVHGVLRSGLALDGAAGVSGVVGADVHEVGGMAEQAGGDNQEEDLHPAQGKWRHCTSGLARPHQR